MILFFCLFVCSFAKYLRIDEKWSVHDYKIYQGSQPINIRGINLNGFENDILAFNGLWKHSMEFYLDTIKTLDFNFIRVPLSIEMIKNNDCTPHPSLVAKDPECINKTSMDILDLFFQKTLKKNFNIVISIARLHKDFKSDLWYDDTYSIQDFINAWFHILDKYHNQSNLVGIDIYDEPNPIISNDWQVFVDSFIYSIEMRYKNNQWIYFIQGHDYGSNFNNLTINNKKIVYTPHVYGQNKSIEELYIKWYNEWAFLPNSVVSRSSRSSSMKYMVFLSNYLSMHNASDTFLWCLNNDPNVGIFKLDWTTIDDFKMDIFNNINN
jgi:hypothetical protein